MATASRSSTMTMPMRTAATATAVPTGSRPASPMRSAPVSTPTVAAPRIRERRATSQTPSTKSATGRASDIPATVGDTSAWPVITSISTSTPAETAPAAAKIT